MAVSAENEPLELSPPPGTVGGAPAPGGPAARAVASAPMAAAPAATPAASAPAGTSGTDAADDADEANGAGGAGDAGDTAAAAASLADTPDLFVTQDSAAPDFVIAPDDEPPAQAPVQVPDQVPAQAQGPAVGLPAPAAAPPRNRWLQRRMTDIALLIRLNRPIGIWLLLWPALWALWIGSGGHPPPKLVLIFVLGTVLMRSAGCVINDLTDLNIDPHVRRTRDRPLAARRMSPHEALAVFAVLTGASFLLALQLNTPALLLSFIGAALTVSYPWFKRFFPLPQFYLGLSFGWAVPMAFAAELGVVPRVGWVLLLATIVWAGVYDTFYAMADRPDDLRIGVKSSAITFGDLDLLMIGAMQVMVLMALALTGRLLGLGAPYFWALAIGAGLFVQQQWLARRRDTPGCIQAFQNNNYFGLIVLAGLVTDYAART